MKIPLGSGKNINVHEEGRIFVFLGLALTIISVFISGFSSFSILSGILAISCAAFFRDPERVLPEEKNIIVSACDGVISAITEELLPPELSSYNQNQKMIKISTFLSVFDVHVNRVPISGKIIAVKYHHGKFLNASLDKASKHNERNSIMIEAENGTKIACVQIAGLVARRIVCDAEVGSFYGMGQRYGIIRFGSRVDVYMPLSAKLNVAVGQTMIAGETILAKLS